MTGIFCAIDAPSLPEAEEIVRKIAGLGLGIKVGLELFVAEGPSCVDKLRVIAGDDTKVFLDLKLHDIPNTVAGAVKSAMQCRADFLTLHTSGGRDMMKRAAEAAAEGSAKTGIAAPRLLGVTVLTHMEENDLSDVGQKSPAQEQVLRLATLAEQSGLTGVVCSPLEIAALRAKLSPKTLLVVPGIRPQGSATGDQKRVMTPAEAAKLGADYLVIGRPITQADDPAAAAGDILKSLSQKAA